MCLRHIGVIPMRMVPGMNLRTKIMIFNSIMSNPDKKIVIRAYWKFSELNEFFKQKMESPRLLADCPKTEEEWKDVGLVMIDEYEAMTKRMADGKFLVDVCRRDVHVIVCSCTTKVDHQVLRSHIKDFRYNKYG